MCIIAAVKQLCTETNVYINLVTGFGSGVTGTAGEVPAPGPKGLICGDAGRDGGGGGGGCAASSSEIPRRRWTVCALLYHCAAGRARGGGHGYAAVSAVQEREGRSGGAERLSGIHTHARTHLRVRTHIYEYAHTFTSTYTRTHRHA